MPDSNSFGKNVNCDSSTHTLPKENTNSDSQTLQSLQQDLTLTDKLNKNLLCSYLKRLNDEDAARQTNTNVKKSTSSE